MNEGHDFVRFLGEDESRKILMSLDDPADLVRASAVSIFWRHLVIDNGLSKDLCQRMFPESSSIIGVIEPRRTVDSVPNEDGDTDIDTDTIEWVSSPKTEHKAFASLCKELICSKSEKCLADALWASSVDNYPEEGFKHTLVPNDKINDRPSYWSSTGKSNPATSESLIYRLTSRLCLVSEVHVHPFEAYFQSGTPLYSSERVRFHMGYSKEPSYTGFHNESPAHFTEERFVWTYSSPEFQMEQANRLQKFKLPKPVLCIGGILKVELIGRVQTQEMDGLYYICVTHVQVIGSRISPQFDIEITEDGKFKLKYDPEDVSTSYSQQQEQLLDGESWCRVNFDRFIEVVRDWENFARPLFARAQRMELEFDPDEDNPMG